MARPVIDQGRQYRVLADRLFNPGEQQLIPFLGAGVPLSARAPEALRAGAAVPTDAEIESAVRALPPDSGAPGTFARIAMLAARLLPAPPHGAEGWARYTTGAGGEPGPPSSAELTQLFSEIADYAPLKDLARSMERRLGPCPTADAEGYAQWLRQVIAVTGLSDGNSLAGITAYFETVHGRVALLEYLSEAFTVARAPTPTHRLLARAARACLEGRPSTDFLIVTTNYDGMMEQALQEERVRFAALWLPRGRSSRQESKMHVEYWDPSSGTSAPEPSHYARNLSRLEDGPWVQLFKMHGSLTRRFERSGTSTADDGIVVSENDYVGYITRMASGRAIPPCAMTLMSSRPFLFLGSSLRDWNVRSVFETVRGQRNPGLRDYVVAAALTEFDLMYFQKMDIQCIETDLASFTASIDSCRRGASPASKPPPSPSPPT